MTKEVQRRVEKKTNQQNKEAKKKHISLSNILNSKTTIIVVLALLVVGLMIYTRYIIKRVELYTVSYFDENISILNGTIYSNYDINYFGDSKIIYEGEDYKIKNFNIGYYIKDGSKYRVVSEVTNIDDMESGASIKELLETTDFSFTEVQKDAKFLSKENLKNLDDLVFLIQGKLDDGDEINIELPLDITKISK